MIAATPEGLSRWRWRLILRRTRDVPVRFLYWPPTCPTGLHKIGMYDPDGYDLGIIIWRRCDHCRLGIIQKISITDPYQRRGLGRRLLLAAARDSPDYTWRTSAQSPAGKAFFTAISRATGIAFPVGQTLCQHLKERRSAQATDRGRPILALV